MLEKAKNAVRVRTTAFDGEISGLIAACIADLGIAGIKIKDPEQYWDTPAGGETPEAGDHLIERAVILYVKANFGYLDTVQAARFEQAYSHLKCALSLSGDYRPEASDGME